MKTTTAAIALLAFAIASLASSAAEASHKYKELKGARQVERREPAPQFTPRKSKDESMMEEHMKRADEEGYDWRKFQSEFGVFGGDFLGDEWYNNWDVGGRYYFNINKMFAFGAEYQYNPIRADSSGDFGKSLRTDNSHTLFGAISIANDAAFKAGKSIIDCDLFLTVGAGSMQINRDWEWLAVIGGGIKVYTPMRWMAVRFDVNSYMHPTPKPGGNSFNADMALNLGFSFFVQPHMKKALSQPDGESASAH